jgi:dienelactone hydrolase
MVTMPRRGFGGAIAAMLLTLWAGAPARGAAEGSEVRLSADDGVRLFGRYLDGGVARAPLLLLFHQAGSSKDEYAPIQPRLAAAGYASLAIDQRSGGSFLGGRNETVAALGNRDASYDEAYADLEAALAWARAQHPGRPVVVWGSSYSAALVFLLAAAHPREIAAVLAFSPGEYLARAGSVGVAAAEVRAPVFVTAAPNSAEEDAAAAIVAVVPAKLKRQFHAPDGGVHGSSTLRDDSNPAGAEAIWAAVLAFLAEAAPTR